MDDPRLNPVKPVNPGPSDGPDPGPPPAAGAGPLEYLTWVLDALQAFALNSSLVDWPAVREQAFAEAAGATTTADTYPAIRLAIAALGDPHTFFVTPEELAQLGGGHPPAEPPRPTGRLIGDDVGYLALPGVTGADIPGYAAAGARAVREVDQAGPGSWIVDLRPDDGGASYPMLDTVAPLLGDGTLGAQVLADGTRLELVLDRGRITVAGVLIEREIPANPATSEAAIPDYVTHNDHVLRRPDPPVAVLTGQATASAGEAVLAAFLGRPSLRTFGEKTAGLATGNTAFGLGDGAMLVLTMSATEDRAGRRYDNTPIPPDVLVDFNDDEITGDPADDPVVRAALEWLRAFAAPGAG